MRAPQGFPHVVDVGRLVGETLVTIRLFHQSAKLHTLSSTSICPTEDEQGDQDTSVFGWHFSFHAEGVETSAKCALCASWTIARDATYFDVDEGRDKRHARPWIAFSWTHAFARDAIKHVRPRKSALHALQFRSRTMSSLPRLVSPTPARAHLRSSERTSSPFGRATRTTIGPCRLPLRSTRSSHVSPLLHATHARPTCLLLSSTNGTVGLSFGPSPPSFVSPFVVNPSPTSQRWCARGWRTTMAT